MLPLSQGLLQTCLVGDGSMTAGGACVETTCVCMELKVAGCVCVCACACVRACVC